MAILQVEGVSKRFRARDQLVVALEQIDLEVAEGEFLTLVGPSGCGKSTLLNLIAGLAAPSSGTLRYRGQPIAGVNRRIGYVTQQDNLFPWRTLRDNVVLALELHGEPAADRRARADAWLARVGLQEFARAYPHELSGGMRQRGNIVRTLIYEPDVILMDEPFGPLDAQTRIVLQDELLKIWEATGKTILFVTHDLTEAISLSDRVVLMGARPGRIVRVDQVNIPRPRDIFFIHDDEEFRRLYDTVWKELEVQVRGRNA